MRWVAILFFLEWLAYSQCVGKEIEIPAETKIRVNRLGKIEAKAKTPVKWINLHEDLDVIPDSTGRFAMILGSKPGRYKIAVYTANKDGPSEPEYAIVVIEDPTPRPPLPPSDPKPPGKTADPVKATAKIRIGNAGCTATVIGPQRADGYWDALTAAHCHPSGAKSGRIELKDGRRFGVKIGDKNPTADLLWLLIETKEDLDFAVLAKELPAVGTSIWHNGYGYDKPGNVERGTVTAEPNAQGQVRFTLNVSSGDSGGGIFREDTGELVAAVCCTTRIAETGAVFGGTSVIAGKMRKTVSLFHPIHFFDDQAGAFDLLPWSIFSTPQDPGELFRPMLILRDEPLHENFRSMR